MGILRTDRITGLGGANAIKGSVEMRGRQNIRAEIVDGNADFNLGSSDYTVECWYHRGGTTGTASSIDQDLVMLWNNTNNRRSWGLYYDASGNLGLIGSSDGTNSDMGSYHSYTFPDNNVWYHVAAVRISNTVTVYVNGAVLGSATVSGSYYKNTQDNLVIGGQLSGTSYDSKIVRGSLSNVRIIIGDGIYTGAFTPPTHELTVTPNTKLLCCQSPSNILQEATGKKLVAYRSSLNDSFAKSSTFTPNTPIGFSTTTNVGSQYGTTFDGFGSFSTSTYMVPPGGNTRERNRGRAVFGGGQSTSYTSAIQIFNIQSQGNTIEVGELSQSNWGLGACGSSTRGLFGGGRTSPGGSGNYLNTIEFVTIANAGNSSDFGDLTRANSYINSLGNQTRGIWAGGYNVDTKPAPNIGSNTIDYVTIATAGNAADFGDMVRQDGSSDTTFSKFSTANSTRGLIAGGYNSGGEQDEITYITIATTGNSTYFGDLTAVSAFGGSGASSSTRGILTVGGTPGPHNRIDFVTIATTGNATDFGDLTLARRYSQGVSNKTRAVFITGYTGSDTNLIDFVTIATTGNATDFGDNDREDNYGNGATSDSHGGIS